MPSASQRAFARDPLLLVGVVAAMSMFASLAYSQAVPPTEGGSYRLARVRVAAGTGEAQSPEPGLPRYRLQATIGQAEAQAQAATSPRYRLRGGFWASGGDLPAPIFADGFED